MHSLLQHRYYNIKKLIMFIATYLRYASANMPPRRTWDIVVKCKSSALRGSPLASTHFTFGSEVFSWASLTIALSAPPLIPPDAKATYIVGSTIYVRNFVSSSYHIFQHH